MPFYNQKTIEERNPILYCMSFREVLRFISSEISYFFWASPSGIMNNLGRINLHTSRKFMQYRIGIPDAIH